MSMDGVSKTLNDLAHERSLYREESRYFKARYDDMVMIISDLKKKNSALKKNLNERNAYIKTLNSENKFLRDIVDRHTVIFEDLHKQGAIRKGDIELPPEELGKWA